MILPPNPFKIPATHAVVEPTVRQYDKRESPQSPAPSEVSSIWTPPMIMSAVEPWETSYDEGTFYSGDELRRIILLSSPPLHCHTQTETKSQHMDVLSQHKGSVAACQRSLWASVASRKRQPRSLYELEWDLTNITLYIYPENKFFWWKSDTWCPRVTPWWMYSMYLLRLVYVSFPYTDPAWDATALEQTDSHLCSSCLYNI